MPLDKEMYYQWALANKSGINAPLIGKMASRYQSAIAVIDDTGTMSHPERPVEYQPKKLRQITHQTRLNPYAAKTSCPSLRGRWTSQDYMCWFQHSPQHPTRYLQAPRRWARTSQSASRAENQSPRTLPRPLYPGGYCCFLREGDAYAWGIGRGDSTAWSAAGCVDGLSGRVALCRLTLMPVITIYIIAASLALHLLLD